MTVTVILPQEIKDEIFEMAALMHPQDSTRLSIVSKRVQACVEKVIYRSLLFLHRDEDDYMSYLRRRQFNPVYVKRFQYTLKSRPADFFKKHVHNAILADDIPLSFAQTFLEKCTGLRHLTLHLKETFQAGGDWIARSASTLESVDTNSRYVLYQMATAGVTFSKLKFLWVGEYVSQVVPSLEHLPALEYMYWNQDANTEDIDVLWRINLNTIVSTAPNLRTLVVAVYSYYFAAPVELWAKELDSSVNVEIIDCERGAVILLPSLYRRWRQRCNNVWKPESASHLYNSKKHELDSNENDCSQKGYGCGYDESGESDESEYDKESGESEYDGESGESEYDEESDESDYDEESSKGDYDEESR